MQTVYPGEEKLKRRLMRQMLKDIFIEFIKTILRRSPEQKTKDHPDSDLEK